MTWIFAAYHHNLKGMELIKCWTVSLTFPAARRPIVGYGRPVLWLITEPSTKELPW